MHDLLFILSREIHSVEDWVERPGTDKSISTFYSREAQICKWIKKRLSEVFYLNKLMKLSVFIDSIGCMRFPNYRLLKSIDQDTCYDSVISWNWNTCYDSVISWNWITSNNLVNVLNWNTCNSLVSSLNWITSDLLVSSLNQTHVII